MLVTPHHFLPHELIFFTAYQTVNVPSAVRGHAPLIQTWLSKDILLGKSEKNDPNK